MNCRLVCDETNKTNIAHPTNTSKEYPEYSAIKYTLLEMSKKLSITSF